MEQEQSKWTTILVSRETRLRIERYKQAKYPYLKKVTPNDLIISMLNELAKQNVKSNK